VTAGDVVEKKGESIVREGECGSGFPRGRSQNVVFIRRFWKKGKSARVT